MARSSKGDPTYDRDRLAIAARQSFKRMKKADGLASCEICGWKPPFEETWTMLQANHVIPVCCGGSDAFDNLILLCPNHHAICGYFPKHKGRYSGPKTKSDLIYWLRRIDKDPEAWVREQTSEVVCDLAKDL